MKINAAIIGLGRIGVILEDDPLRIKPCTHIGAMKNICKINVVAGCDINPDRRNFFSNRWGVKTTYFDYREMLSSEKIKLLTIATWTDSHAEIVRAAAKNSHIKTIICEKPIARNSKDGLAMVKDCHRNGKILVINHERRFEDRYRLVKKIIGDGRIGQVRTIIGNVLTSVPQKQKSFDINGTSLLHDGTHLIDIIQYLAGPVRSVFGFIGEKRKECVTAVMELTDGTTSFIETGGLRNYFNFELDIQGTDGRILIGNTMFKLYKSVKSGHYTGFRDLKEIPMPKFKEQNYFINEYLEVLEKMEGQSEEIRSSGVDGLATLRVIEAIFNSIRKDGRRIYL